MDFQCYICQNEFNDLGKAISHLKKNHSVTDNTSKIKCLVKHNDCGRQYNSFKAVRAHAVLCVKSKQSSATDSTPQLLCDSIDNEAIISKYADEIDENAERSKVIFRF